MFPSPSKEQGQMLPVLPQVQRSRILLTTTNPITNRQPLPAPSHGCSLYDSFDLRENGVSTLFTPRLRVGCRSMMAKQ